MAKSLVSAAIVVVLVLSVLVAVVSFAAAPAKAAAPFRTLTVGVVNMNVVTYNPLSITLVDEYIVVYNVYSTLVTYDAGYHVRGDLAYNWTLSTDQLTWTFHLVHNAYFTDPTNPGDRSHPVTSADVLYSFQLNQAQTGSILHSYTSNIASMATPDTYTFSITTTAPFSAIYSTASAIPILPQYVWSGVNNPVHYANSNPIGSGAMYYDSVNATFGSNIILRKNPNYYGPAYYCQQVRPDQVFYKDYTSVSTMVSDFKSGASGLDAVMNIDPPNYLSALPANGPSNPITKFTVDTGFVGEFSINVMTPAIRSMFSQFKAGSNNQLLLNDTVRLAVAMSINKSALVKDALLGLGNVADSLVPDSNPWHYSIPVAQQYKFNTTQARALLNAAGWAFDAAGNPATSSTTPLYQTGGTNPLSFRFFTLNTAAEWQVAAIDIQAWLAAAGIQTLNAQGKPGYSLESVSQLSGAWFTGDYDMWLWDWVFTPASDPSLDVMEVETTMAIGPTSDNFYSNTTYDSTYNQSLVTLDPTARRQLTNTLQTMVYNYHSYILPYYRLDLYAASNGEPTAYTAGWTNWGNWTQDVGLTPDSDLPNLWFQVNPIDNKAPTITAFPTVSYYNTVPTTITVSASDPENDIANYFWSFGDGSFANTTTASVQHTYASVGTYAVNVKVSDPEWFTCGSTTATISQYTPGQNLPPQAGSIVPTLTNGTYGLANLSQTFGVTVSDPDDTQLNVTWNFGDGKTTITHVTGVTSSGVNATVTHAYTAAGTFTVSASVTDNKTGGSLPHTVDATPASVQIRYASQGGGGGGGGGGGTTGAQSNPWINYGVPLIIVAVVVVAVAVVLLRRRSTTKKEAEELQQPPQPPGSPPPP